ILVVTAGLLAIGCAAQSSNGKNWSGEALRDQLEQDWKYWMAQYPEMATAFGYPGHNARWTDYSQAAISTRADYLKSSTNQLATIDRPGLSAEEQVNYDLYREILNTAVEGLVLHNDANPIKGVIPRNLLMPINQLEGIQQDIPRTFAMTPAQTREDYEEMISRLERVPVLVDQTISLMQQGLAVSMTPPKITFRDVPNQVKAQIFDDPLKSPMLEALSKMPATITATDKANLKDRAANAYQQNVVPAFTKLYDFLTKQYLPGCRETIDAASLQNGTVLYAYNVKWHTTTNKTPQEIHEIGLAEVKRIRGDMDKVMAAAGFKGNYEEFKTFLRTSPKFYFSD